jgi:hypothetical protein
MTATIDPFMALADAIADAVLRKMDGRALPGQADISALMPIPVAAKYMGRTTSSVRGLIATGQIPQKIVKRIGSRVFLLRRELDKWIDAQ